MGSAPCDWHAANAAYPRAGQDAPASAHAQRQPVGAAAVPVFVRVLEAEAIERSGGAKAERLLCRQFGSAQSYACHEIVAFHRDVAHLDATSGKHVTIRKNRRASRTTQVERP